MSDQTVLKIIFTALICHEMALYLCLNCNKVLGCENAFKSIVVRHCYLGES